MSQSCGRGKLKVTVTAASLFVFLGCTSVVSAQTFNWFSDSGFESGTLTGWTVTGANANITTNGADWDSEQTHLRINHSLAAQTTELKKTFTLPSGTYKFRVQAKRTNHPVTYSQIKAVSNGTTYSAGIPISTTYQQVEIGNINVANGTVDLYIRMSTNTAGAIADIDDLEFVRTDVYGQNLSNNDAKYNASKTITATTSSGLSMTYGLAPAGGGGGNYFNVNGVASNMINPLFGAGGWQTVIRSGMHGGKYNPTQMGFTNNLGTGASLTHTNESIPGTNVNGDKLSYSNVPITLWRGDGKVDFNENEDLGPDGYTEATASPIASYVGDVDNDPENGKTQEDEIKSDFDLTGYIQDYTATLPAADRIPVIKKYVEAAMTRASAIQQFGADAFKLDGSYLLNPSQRAVRLADSGTNSNISPSDTDISNMSFDDIVYWIDPTYTNYMTLDANGNWVTYNDYKTIMGRKTSKQFPALELGDYNVPVVSTNSDVRSGTDFVLAATGTNPDTAQAVGVFYPVNSPVNKNQVVGMSGGTVLYTQDRSYRHYFSGLSPSTSLTGLLAPNSGVVEKVRKEYYLLRGTPNQIKTAVNDLKATFYSGQTRNGGFGTDYDFDTDLQGWTASVNVSGLSSANGQLQGTITGSDPYVVSSDNLTDVDLDENPYLRIRMTVTSGQLTSTGTAAIYFKTNANPTTWQTASFSITPNAGSQLYTLNMHNLNAAWAGTLKQLRIDPVNGNSPAVTTGSFSIDAVKVLDTGAQTPPPSSTIVTNAQSTIFTPNGTNDGTNDPSNGLWLSPDNLNIDVSNLPKLSVLFNDENTSLGNKYTLSWQRTGEAGSPWHTIPFQVFLNDYPTNYDLYLQNNPDWTGSIKRIEIQGPDSTGTSGKYFTVNSISASNVTFAEYNFNTNGDTEGWTANSTDISNFAAANGSISGTITGNDTQIFSPNNLHVNANYFKGIKIRLKNTTDATQAAIYYTTDTEPSFSSDKVVTFPIDPQSGFTVYTVDLPVNFKTFKQLRLDPTQDPSNPVTSGSFAIDYVKIISE